MKKIIILIFITAISVLVLTGCGPNTDTTDPLSGYDVDVNLPFATAKPDDTTYSLTTPEPTVLIGWNGETIVLAKDEYTELTQGSIGTKVKNLQKRLIELGYMTGSVSGTFDYATTLAVKRFEATFGRTQTGIATILMQYYLYSETAPIYSGDASVQVATETQTVYRTLQRGDSGEDVYRLCQRLIELGYMSGKATNYYDADAENGVKAFESAYNQTRTGIATIQLQKFLLSDSAKSSWQIAAETTPIPTPTPTPAPWSYYKELSKGDSGESVRELQNRLRELGYMTAKADGKYGDKTVEAVKAFEEMYGRTPTGVATPQLQYYLYSNNAVQAGTVTAAPTTSTYEHSYSMLNYGDYGDAVVMLQERLKALGYLDGSADGYYGKATQAAVSAFETANGKIATGVATAALQEYLFSDNATASTTTTEEVTSVYMELSLGSYGADVKELQQRLSELGYYKSNISGYFDTNTENAVKAFEAAYGRKETGIATELLQTYLYSGSARANTETSSTVSYPSLKKGDKGNNVARLQLRLIELGYLAGTVDGYYGDGTASAVKAFEAACGKTQTGSASSDMQAILFSESAPANDTYSVAYSYSTLEKGSTGDAVVNLQNRLIELGFITGKASGTYDDNTVKAVKAFQKASGLTQTGIATSALQRELFSVSAADNTGEEPTVTVNKKAYVSVAETYVYASLSADSAYSVIGIGTEVTIVRTKGIWAEIKNAKGNTGYALIENFTYTNPASTSSVTVTVNKQAIVSVDKLVVFGEPSDDSDKLGTLKKGTYITWLRTRGDWAEIQNSAGDIGYVHSNQITALSTADLPGGTDSGNVITEYTRLSYKSTGTAVKQLQTRLKALGYFNGETAGNYLDKTKAAVQAFEKAIGLVPTGIATEGLQDIMYCKAAPRSGAYASSTQREFSDLSYGEKSDAVGNMQKRLVALGYLSTSGCTYAEYDEATTMAVMDVQEAMGLQNVDGIATRELQAFLLSNASASIKR